MNNTINDKILKTYEHFVNTPSDINEHIPTLLEYAKDCKHITELGVRWVISTYPFILANPNKLVSIDIKHPTDWDKKYNVDERLNDLNDYAKNNNINYSFILGDSLDMNIEETDLLFIDTLHVYRQLSEELKLHGNKAKKYIIFHDTTTYGFIDEIHEDLGSKLSKSVTIKRGLQAAISEFLIANSEWSIDKIFTNCNGLTILKRN
jgi:hypothetical protein